MTHASKSKPLVIGVVGKPSAGKSSFLNATTSAKAKVGNYPFTTITPNRGVHLYRTRCACSQFPLFQPYCTPNHGKCVGGTRYIPVELLDVAGLIPGASEGLGLGNQFLDDLRHAHVLIHVVDVSGTTDEKGQVTMGYDPSHDIDWLNGELHAWIFNNLWKRWSSILSRHKRKKCSIVETLTDQLSGYGCSKKFMVELCEQLNLCFSHFDSSVSASSTTTTTTNNNNNHNNHNNHTDAVAAVVVTRHLIETWDESMVRQFVWDFLRIRFPTVFALNKIDMKASAKNIDKLCKKYDEDRIVLTSALSEIFLRKMASDGYIHYLEGSDDFITLKDVMNGHNHNNNNNNNNSENNNSENDDRTLKPIENQKHETMLDNVRDFVLFRYGTTGVYQAVAKAIELQKQIAVYPVSYSLTALHQQQNNNDAHHVSEEQKQGMFQDVVMIKQGTSVRSFVHKAYRPLFDRHRQQQQQEQLEQHQQEYSKHRKHTNSTTVKWYCESEDGRRLSETEPIMNDCTLLRVVFTHE